jgi:predicted  nucleic acid-binding Zn-ribbon protein
MPKKPAPPPAALKRTFKPPKPRQTSSRPQKSSRRGAAGLGAAAAGAAVAGAFLTLNTASAHPDIAMDVNSLQTTLSDLQNRSDFSEITSDLANLDSTINHVLNLLESARDKGYVYQGDMEDIAYDAVDRWQSVRGQVEQAIGQQSQVAQDSLNDLDPYIQRLNANLKKPSSASAALKQAQDQANQVLWDLQSAESTLEDNYEDIENDIRQLNSRLTTIHWAIDQLAEARFNLEDGEDLVMAVPNRWDKEGKDDPEGILYLTNKRLVFERKEKVATKKVLFVTTSSEMVQEVVFDQSLNSIASLKAQSKGLFGHQDFMEVEFSDSNLGTLSLHINGQDSKEWVTLIERTKSGQIEDERTSGSGISFTDLTGPLTSGDLLDIQNEVNELQDEMMLKDVQDDLSELENEVHSLARDLADLRARGYAVEKSLEADLEVLTAQWDQVKTRAVTTVENQTKILSEQMAVIQDDLAKLMGMSSNLNAARPHFIRLKSAIASAEAQAEAAEDTVLDLYDEYADEVESLATHFEWADWMLEALSTASFRLLATESGVAATEAVWERPGLEPENGILFLTDQRVLWEDRVDDYELKIAVPLQQVTEANEVSDEEVEFDVISISFDSPDAPVPAAKFQLALPVADDWLEMIGRARAGDYAEDRAIEIDEADLERVRNAPEQCSNCGAAFTSPVLRGQSEISCEYCGVVTRI